MIEVSQSEAIALLVDRDSTNYAQGDWELGDVLIYGFKGYRNIKNVELEKIYNSELTEEEQIRII